MLKIVIPIIVLALMSCTNSGAITFPIQSSSKLSQVLASQSDDLKARYQYRNPEETLEFFGIEAGMTVLEAYPGGGWYSKILLPYLGSEGQLIGVQYPNDVWGLLGLFDAKEVARREQFVTSWPVQANAWRDDSSASIVSVEFGLVPESIAETADAAIFVRALHNLLRFEKDTGSLTTALSETYATLKPGGILGVVQHHAPDAWPSELTGGAMGYLNKQALIDKIQEAGFEYLGSSEVNANPKDQPTEKDIVWRLPPVRATAAAETPERQAQFEAIGESNRMTLKFRKPS